MGRPGTEIETRIVRGRRPESIHRTHAVLFPRDADEPLIYGSSRSRTFLRSVAKPFQTLVLFRAGVIDAYEITDEELAVITAAHAGEAYHHELVESLLVRADLSPADLECGIHAPYSRSERLRRLGRGEALSPLGNNCSGKHAGMLLHACHVGAPTRGYLEPDHPVQLAVREMLELFTGQPMTPASMGVDGCGVPTYDLPLTSIASAFHRLHDSGFLEKERLARPVERLHAALAQHPRAFSGEGRLPLRFAASLGGTFLSKEGAEGVFAVWGPRGTLVLKTLDGHERGYRWALPELLEHHGWLGPEPLGRWRQDDPPVVLNVAGRPVGRVEVVIPPR